MKSILLLIVFFLAPAVRAAGGADFLRVTPDSHSAALGNSGAADGTSFFSAYRNPALVSAGDKLRVAAGQTEWLLGVRLAHYAVSTAGRTASGRPWGAGFFMSGLSADSFEATDAQGRAAGQAGYGARLTGVTAGTAVRRLRLGATLKKVEEWFEDPETGKPTASTLACDAGLAFRAGTITFGAAVQNLGGRLKRAGEDAPLPRILRAGAQGGREGKWGWSAESVSDGESVSVKGGVSFEPAAAFRVRVGYDTLLSESPFLGFTAGFGFRAKSFEIDYAAAPVADIGLAQRLSVGWRWNER